MTNEKKRNLFTATLILGVVASFFIGGLTSSDRTRSTLEAEYLIAIGQLEDEHQETRNALDRAQSSLAEGTRTLVLASNRIGRSQDVARNLSFVISGLRSGNSELDDLMGAIAEDLEWIANELSAIYSVHFTKDTEG